MNRNEQEVVVCDCCKTVPVSHLGLDLAEPIGGWSAFFAAQGIAVTPDALGRPSVPRHVLGELLSERREREARLAAEQAERAAARKAPIPAGIPFPKGADAEMSAFEVMRGADAEAEQSDPDRRISPHEEFLMQPLGRPRKVVTEEK